MPCESRASFESTGIIPDHYQPTMLTPDYQEFANRAGRATPWQYRDFRHSHG